MRAVILRLSAALRDEKRFADPEELDEEFSGLRANELCPTAGELFFVFAPAWPEDAREALAVFSAPAFDAEGVAARADAAPAAAVLAARVGPAFAAPSPSSSSRLSRNALKTPSGVSSPSNLKYFIGTSRRFFCGR